MNNVTDMFEHRRKQALDRLIESQRWCPYTGDLLKADAVVFNSAHNAPLFLVSPTGYALMEPEMLRYLSDRGTKPDPATIPKEVP